MKQYEVTFAGFGGQGVLLAGQLLAYAAIKEGKNVVWIPSYGPEMRGGTAYCTVVISDQRIGSPIINNPFAACVFNRPSFDKFMPKVRPGGLLMVNSSLINTKTDRTDITEHLVPASKIAMEAGSGKATNVVMLGAFVAASGVVAYETVRKTIEDKLSSKAAILQTNYTALERGFAIIPRQTAGSKA
ncbi:MAG: 2-oxoacid:acceptor oxidoreductase family protein [candidate division Zixibacteria bacterium]|nr:2-oxoacid:acceptor oxidoreductase family protein [candidate division Zixibacteria bacterium]